MEYGRETAFTQLRHSSVLLAGTVAGMFVTYCVPAIIRFRFFAGRFRWGFDAFMFPDLRFYAQPAPMALFLPAAAVFYCRDGPFGNTLLAWCRRSVSGKAACRIAANRDPRYPAVVTHAGRSSLPRNMPDVRLNQLMKTSKILNIFDHMLQCFKGSGFFGPPSLQQIAGQSLVRRGFVS